jgi:hypothetical protein
VKRFLSRLGKLKAPRGKKEKAQSQRERNFLKIAFILRRREKNNGEKESKETRDTGGVLFSRFVTTPNHFQYLNSDRLVGHEAIAPPHPKFQC